MTALLAPLSTSVEEQGAGLGAYPMADNVKVYKGGMVMVSLATGLAQSAADIAGGPWIVVGEAMDTVDNTVVGHAAGSWPPSPLNWVTVRFGVSILYGGSGFSQASVGSTVYVSDDNNVAASNTYGAVAGTVEKYESSTQVYVYLGPPMPQTSGWPQTAKVPLAAVDTAGGLFSWQCPINAIIDRLWIDVTTVASGACTGDFGVATASATTLSDTLIDGADLHSATALFDNMLAATQGTNGAPSRKCAAGKWVTGSTASGASAALVGNAYISYRPS